MQRIVYKSFELSCLYHNTYIAYMIWHVFRMVHILQRKKAVLVLEDGTSFHGFSFGAEIPVQGEVVFNTGMVSYPESMTDPSYAGQILVFTYPLIGNYGVPEKKEVDGILYSQESEHIHPKAIIVAEYSDRCNHWESVKSLEGFE